MSQPMTSTEDQQPVLRVASLTDEIKAFTASAIERMPADYIEAFRALVSRLVEEKIGQSAPAIGAQFPDFVLQDEEGHLVRASDRWDRKTLVVKFYRGGWCPYCHLELAALRKYASEFAAANVEILAVAPEKPVSQAATKQKAGATFAFLWDEDSTLAQRLGIAFEVDAAVKDIYRTLKVDLDLINGSWVLPVPATFVVRNGLVRYRLIDPNYLQRQDPEDLLSKLRTIDLADVEQTASLQDQPAV